jgi:hypothetical protein
MRVQILEDGTVKVTTGKIGAQNHMSADAMLAYLAKLLGGKTTIESRGDHAHVHTHGEDHVHN